MGGSWVGGEVERRTGGTSRREGKRGRKVGGEGRVQKLAGKA